jgi:hypothetical protein
MAQHTARDKAVPRNQTIGWCYPIIDIAAAISIPGCALVHAIFVAAIVATISPIHVTLAAFGLLVDVLRVSTPALPCVLKAKILE